MRRALLAAAVALPAAAFAATTPNIGQLFATDTYAPTAQTKFSYINAAHCATNGTIPLEWNIQVIGGLPFTGNGAYQIYATDTQPTTDTTTGGTFCAETTDLNKSPPVHAAQVGAFPVAGTSGIQDGAVPGTQTVAAANFTCANESKTVYICAHWVDANNMRRGFAVGTFLIQTAAPAPPTGVTVGSGDASLIVSWTASTIGSSAANPDHYIATATQVCATPPCATPAPTFSSSQTTGTTATIKGLQNGVAYDVTVTAYSVGSNPSTASTPAVQGTPYHVADVFEFYKASGGQGEGGCGSPAGALSILGAAALLLATRRRK